MTYWVKVVFRALPSTRPFVEPFTTGHWSERIQQRRQQEAFCPDVPKQKGTKMHQYTPGRSQI